MEHENIAQPLSPSERFFALKGRGQKDLNFISVKVIEGELGKRGLKKDDLRLKDFLSCVYKASVKGRVEKRYFLDCLNTHVNVKTLIDRAIMGKLVIPHFEDFTNLITPIYNEVRKIKEGDVASYIPQLKKITPDKFGISICTVDGQRFSLGDCSEHFSIQSCFKPFNYLLALEEHGEDTVHKYIGREPSGHSFNEITLDYMKRPHNPMINAGAIVSASLVKSKMSMLERFDYILNVWEKATGGIKPHFNDAVYLSEKETADRNFALAYFMNEHGAFPKNTNLLNTLDFYMRCCSVELTTDYCAIAAATLAKSGENPFSGERVFESENIKNCLSLMHSSGMYDYSGEFAFTVGLPAKSGVGGGLVLVIPNVMGVCIWSPPLDKNGNSVRGIEFCKWLVEIFNFHPYSDLSAMGSEKVDPRLRKSEEVSHTTAALCISAAENHTFKLEQLIAQGADLLKGDYDGRTPLHIASGHGHLKAVKILIENGADKDVKDLRGGTALDDAKKEGHKGVINFLQSLKP